MPQFKCEMQMPEGEVVVQTISADSLAEAQAQARSTGGYVLNIAEAGGGDGLIAKMQNIRLEGGPGLKDLISFTKQLSVMIKAGISIRDAIETIAEPVVNQKFKKVLDQIRLDVESGVSFSAALAKHPKVFSPLYVNMVRASEMSGQFAAMLERLNEYLAEQDEVRRMVIGAMIYPAVLFTMSISAVVFLLSFVLPKFMAMFRGKEALLPKPTIALMAMSDFMRGYWYVLVGSLAAIIILLVYAVKTPQGAIIFDKFKLRVPIFSKMLRCLYITRSLQSLGELMNAGVPILESLQITADIAANYEYRALWEDVSDSVREGNKIVFHLSTNSLLPKPVVQMIAAGEESGRLGDVLTDIADYYAKELRSVIKAVTALIEPIMIVFMGFVVGFIAMSIILPVFKMGQLVE